MRLIDKVGRESLFGHASRDDDDAQGHRGKCAGNEAHLNEMPLEEQPSLAAARMFSRRGLAVPAWAGLLALIEEFVETWDAAQSRRRASEEAVHIRDGYRCMAPGCTSRKNLQEHHVHYRSQGGSNDLANRVCLCAFHHLRGEHGELLSCRGTAPLRLEWSLGRGGRGGLFRNEMRLKG